MKILNWIRYIPWHQKNIFLFYEYSFPSQLSAPETKLFNFKTKPSHFANSHKLIPLRATTLDILHGPFPFFKNATPKNPRNGSCCKTDRAGPYNFRAVENCIFTTTSTTISTRGGRITTDDFFFRVFRGPGLGSRTSSLSVIIISILSGIPPGCFGDGTFEESRFGPADQVHHYFWASKPSSCDGRKSAFGRRSSTVGGDFCKLQLDHAATCWTNSNIKHPWKKFKFLNDHSKK